jgi:hypothetical protein
MLDWATPIFQTIIRDLLSGQYGQPLRAVVFSAAAACLRGGRRRRRGSVAVDGGVSAPNGQPPQM